MDTIFALASARGKAGIAVFRISGPQAFAAVAALCDPLPEPRQAALRRLTWQGEVLDDALVLLFAEGHSFTGEAVAELQVHGSVAVTQALTRALGAMPGLRIAEPGEFSRRALENGRLDLTQIEGLADLIEAETEMQRRQAIRVLSGAIGKRAQGWRRKLIRAAALIEAVIDFVDEDVPVDVTPEVRTLLGSVIAELRLEVEKSHVAERVRDGFVVAIVGAPNVGKSTLLNALAGREAAITSEFAGTTRDIIEVQMNLAGLPVTLLDTAGLRYSDDPVETIGISRGMERAAAADLRVFMLSDEDEDLLLAPLAEDILVRSKADLGGTGVSGLTGKGIDKLIEQIVRILEARVAGAGVLTRERHRVAMVLAIGAMESAMDELESRHVRGELVATELRRGLRFMDQLVGRIDVETLLDEIFASFCIGK